MTKQILSITKISVLALVISFGASYALAWTPPSANPPLSNVAAPINIGTADQTKAGDICTSKGGTTKCLSTGGASLPSGTVSQTLRHDGTTWVASSILKNDGSGVFVGTGTNTYPTTPAGAAALTLNGTSLARFVMNDGTGNFNQYLNAYYDSAAGQHKYVTSAPANLFAATAGVYSLNVAPAGTAGNPITWTNALYVDNAGKVGLGTAAPGSSLEVANTGMPVIGLNNTGASSVATGIRFQKAGANQMGIGTDVAGNGTRNMWFHDYVAGVTRMLIDPTGNVGIGTTAPGAKLDVAGDIDVTGGSGTAYTTAPIEVRTTATPRISFHWPGVVASQLGMDSSGTIRTYNNPGTGYENFAAAAITATNGLYSNNGLTVGNGGGLYSYIAMQDSDESPNGLKYIHANTNNIGFLSGQGGWITRWDNAGNQITGGTLSTGGDATINGVTVGRGAGSVVTNTTLGLQALVANSTGINNVAIGNSALSVTTGSGDNTAVGFSALKSTQAGSNTALGSTALQYSSTGSGNTAVGASALGANTTGSYNTAVGLYALSGIAGGAFNTAVGYSATVYPGGYNSTALGYGAVAPFPNMIRLGNNAVTQIGGQVGWSTLSDVREKENIVDYAHGLDFIMKLRPVSFTMKADTTKVVHNGFIAQEVEATGVPFYGLSKPANKNDFYKLDYSQFVVPLVNSVKELKKENDQLKADNAALLKRVEAIEAKLK